MLTVHRMLASAIGALLLLGSASPSLSQEGVIAPGAELFTNASVWRIRLELKPEALESLRQDRRRYVEAAVTEGTNIHPNVGVHLKGATGSSRPLEDKPSFTLAFDKFSSAQRFHGLRKIHLNNSVEDPSYLNEHLGGELFRAAGVPAARATHALVELNGRKLGLYVLKEGFAEEFLARHFRRSNGNLYDIDPGHDVNERLRKESGDGPEDGADLRALAAAAGEPDLFQRWQRLGLLLDVDRFVSFMAMEIMAGHRDGYCLARNNFRIYHDPEADRLVFLPHGMDQLFGKADYPWQPRMAGLVARAVMETPEGQKLYRERFRSFLTNVFDVAALTNRANELIARLRPALDAAALREVKTQAAIVRDRITARRADLERQLNVAELKPLVFDQGTARLSGWRVVDVPEGGALDAAKAPDGRSALRILAGPVTSASWRCRVLLERGRYRFEGLVSASGVKPLEYGRNKGATLRVTNAAVPRPAGLIGDSVWKKLTVEFEVAQSGEPTELVCELRAREGQAWFDTESLRLVRVK